MRWFAARLSLAVYDTNREIRMGVQDLKDALAHIPGIRSLRASYAPNGNQVFTTDKRTVEVSPMAGLEEIERALTETLPNPFERPKMSTIGELLKSARAEIAEARQGAANAVAESADATKVVLQEVEKVRKEAAELRAEVAELTNGGPE